MAWPMVAALFGPGLVVMLADTDAGSIITAAQSGARWGYAMIVPQLLLIPVLYVVQEMTIRLGVLTGQGHGALIRQRFGRNWAVLSAGTLFVSAIGALITELAAVAGVGELFGVSRWLSVPVATTFLIAAAFTGRYARLERIGIALGLAEAAFVAAMLASHPSGRAVAAGMASLPLGNGSYLYLLAANVGAVIMPWMIFYQQGAVIDKGLRPSGIRRERAGTAIGAAATQLVMIAVVVTLAATVGHGRTGASLGTVGEISAALQPSLGVLGAKVLFGAGMLGAALVAALVSSLAGAWGLAEIFGWEHTLDRRPRAGHVPGRGRRRFYFVYAATHVAGAVLVLASVDLIGLAIDVEVMNALLLPVVLGFLVALEAKVLPPAQRMRGWYKWTAWALCAAVSGFGLYLMASTLRPLAVPAPGRPGPSRTARRQAGARAAARSPARPSRRAMERSFRFAIMAERVLRADAQRNRDKVLRAAREVFAASGFGAPLDEIAARAGVGPGTVYRHFPNKEALFEAVVTSRLADLIADAHARAGDPDPGAAFFGFLGRIGQDAAGKRDLPDAIALPGTMLAELHAVLDTLLRHAQQVGAVRDGVTAQELLSLLTGVLAAIHETEGGEPAGDVRARMLAIVSDGLRPPSA